MFAIHRTRTHAKAPLLLLGLFVITVIASGTWAVLKAPQAEAATSSYLNFQARLLTSTGTVVPDGNYHIEFKIYDTVSSGASAQGVCSLNSGTDDCWWLETRTTGNLVRVVNGYFSVQLGSVTAFGSSIPWDQQLWLTMRIGGSGGAAAWDPEMLSSGNRIQLTGVPYAFTAGRLQNASGAITNQLVFATPSGTNKTLTLPDETGTVCTTGSVCAGYQAAGSTTLQSAYDGGGAGDQVIALDNTQDSIVIRNPASNGSDSTYTLTLDQLSTGARGGLSIQSAGTGNLLLVTDTTATARDVLTIADGGATTFRNQTNSTTAFQVQNAAGGSLFTLDSTNGGLASLLSANSGETHSWQTNSSTGLTASDAHCTVTANGYFYVITGMVGGSATNAVQYAKMNANGSLGNWSTTTAVNVGGAQNRAGAACATANGYVYVIAGSTNNSDATSTATAYYAKLNFDGTVGNWAATTSIPAQRWYLTANVHNGYIYAIGGNNTSGGATDTVYYAKLNPDGTVGSWSTNNIGNNASAQTSAVANGYLYVTSGSVSTGVRYSKLGASGVPGSWNSTTALPEVRYWPSSVVANGYLYIIAGSQANNSNFRTTVYFGQLASDGTIPSWSTASQQLAVGKNSFGQNGVIANGYMYAIGGWAGSTQNNQYYASVPRVQIGGGLDLVGLSGENLNEGGTGGELTAGNTRVIGLLGVQGQATFAQSVSVNGELALNGNIGFSESQNQAISVAQRNSNAIGRDLTISAGAAGSGGSAFQGGSLILQGGAAAGTGNANGGSVTIAGGAGVGTGVKGLVNVGPAAFSSVTESSCAANCNLTQANIDGYSTVIVHATTAGITITLPDPTITSTNGRIIYITAANGSTEFSLLANGGGSLIDILMKQNVTAALVWNGTDWAAAGASNATTLQATYDNGTNPGTTPEIKLDSTHGTIDIQDADTTIGADLFNIRASNAGNLGTVMLGVGNTGTVTIRNTTDQQAAFRFQNAAGSYVLNVNTANNYIINNGIRTLGNELSNPGFEAGAEINTNTSTGEQGWFGSAQSVTVNGSSDARSGNHYLQVTPNGTNLDTYGGTYYEVKPDDIVYFEGYVKNSAGANGTGGIQLTFYDKDKANPVSSTDYGTLPGTSYILKSVNATVPSGKYFVRASASVRSGATSGTYYFDDFLLTRNNRQAPVTFRNTADSTTAFVIQSAAAADTLFTVDTSNNILKVGNNTGTNTATTILVLDSATANPSTLTNKDGGLFYRSDQGSLKTVLSGAVYDVCTTAVVCTGYGSGAGGSNVQLQASSPGIQQTGHFNISGTGILTQLQTMDVSTASTNSSNLTIRTGNASGSSSNSGNLVLDVGTATGTRGTITIGSSGVATTMPGTLAIQGASALSLGTASTNTGTIRLYNNVGSNHVTISADGSNPTSSWTLSLPQNPSTNSGYCLKASNTSGAHTYSDCGVGATVTMQDTYNNSSSPANILLADGKGFQIQAQETSTDPSILFDLQCDTCSANGGRFAVQNDGTDVFTVLSGGTSITLGVATQVGSATTNATQTNLQLDSFSTFADSGTCNTTTNQGALYYNTASLSVRTCQDSSWVDVLSTKDLGLFMFGVVPDSGANPWDLASKVTAGASGPCKVSYNTATSVTVNACIAYSGGRRVNVVGGTITITGMNTTTNRFAHICLTASDNQPALSTVGTAFTANLPTFSISAPILCLASIEGSATTANNIENLYDVRTFTDSQKVAITASTAFEPGMLAQSATSSASYAPTASDSQRLRGVVVASNGSTSSTTPNAIMVISGPAYAKATAGTLGDVVNAGTTAGYADTISARANNVFNYALGTANNAYSTTCSSASNCLGSLYVDVTIN